MAKLVSVVDSNITAPDRTLIDVVLERDGVQVQGLGITYLESFDEHGNELTEQDPDYCDDVYDEWMEYAISGEEGFTILQAK